MVPSTLRYTNEHEWVKVEQERGLVGIGQFAQEALGDIVYVEFPEAGRVVKIGEEIGEVESTKATSPIYSPVNGTIARINEGLQTSPDLVNSDPYGEGWIVEITLDAEADVSHLMDHVAYEAYIRGEGND